MATSLSNPSTDPSTPVYLSPSSLQEFSALPLTKPDGVHYGVPYVASAPASKFHETPPPALQRQKEWPRFGATGDKSYLPLVAELQDASQSQSDTLSTKGTQSSSTDNLLLPEAQSSSVAEPSPKDPKNVQKEAVCMAREAVLQRLGFINNAK